MKTFFKGVLGITLIEVMVATLIAVMVLLALLMSFVMGRFSASVAKHKSQAINLLRARMEEMRDLGYETLQDLSENTPVTTENNLALDVSIDSGEELLCSRVTTITDSNPADNLLEIKVEISWTELTFGGDVDVSEEVYTSMAGT